MISLNTARTRSISGFDSLQYCCTPNYLGLITLEYSLYQRYLGILDCSYMKYSEYLGISYFQYQYSEYFRVLYCKVLRVIEYYSQYFTRIMKYSGVQYSRYSEYSGYYCLCSSISTAHAPSTRRFWAFSTDYTPSTPSIQATSTLVLGVLGVQKKLDTRSKHTRSICVFLEIVFECQRKKTTHGDTKE